jgi:hypothetical protein
MMNLVCRILAIAPWILANVLLAGEASSTHLTRSLQVVAEGAEVRVSGFTSQGTVALIGVAREPLAGAASVEAWVETLQDADGDGAVVLDLERTVPLKSAWGAVELATGESNVTVADGFPLTVVRPGTSGYEIDSQSGVALFRIASERLRILLVRPGAGAWSLKAYDAGVGDTGNLPDGIPDGWIRIDPTDLEPLRPEYGDLPGLERGDLIAAIDEKLLTIYLLRGADAPTGN